MYRKEERKREMAVLAKKRETASRDLYHILRNVPLSLKVERIPFTLTMNILSRLHVHVVTIDRLVRKINGNSIETLAISDYSVV